MTQTTSDLVKKHCQACNAATPKVLPEQISHFLRTLPGWTQENGQIIKTYKFQNYYETIAFVNAVAWISHREDHHPDLEVGYNKCKVRYNTHAVGGLSENDFICAAKVERMIDPQA